MIQTAVFVPTPYKEAGVLVSCEVSGKGPSGDWTGGSGGARSPTPLECSVLSNRISISQCGVCGNRSIAIALTGLKGVPLTRLEGALQRLWGNSKVRSAAGSGPLEACVRQGCPSTHTYSTKLAMAARGLQET